MSAVVLLSELALFVLFATETPGINSDRVNTKRFLWQELKVFIFRLISVSSVA